MEEPMDAQRLLDAYGDTLLRLCLLYLGDQALAEDAVQETFLRELRAWPRFRGESNEETWLTRIAINVCKNELRSPWRRRRAPAESLDTLAVDGPAPEDDTLVRTVSHLPLKYREVVVLYYYREWSTTQIAQRLGLSVSTVTVRLSRARKMLYERLEGWYYGRA